MLKISGGTAQDLFSLPENNFWDMYSKTMLKQISEFSHPFLLTDTIGFLILFRKPCPWLPDENSQPAISLKQTELSMFSHN